MRQSSGFSMVCAEGRPGGDKRPEDVDAATSEGDDGLMMALSFAPLSFVEGAAERVGEGAEGRLVEDAFELVVGVARPLQTAALAGLAQHRRQAGGAGQGSGGAEAGDAACRGQELGGEDGPHSRQAADEGPVRVGLDELGEPAIDGRQSGAAGDRLFSHLADERGGDSFRRQLQIGVGKRGRIGGLGERLWVTHGLGAQMPGDGLRLGASDLGGGDVTLQAARAARHW